MNPLEELESRAIPVTWATVELGLEGPGSAIPQIGLADVQSWVEAALARGSEPDRAVDVVVAIENDADARQIIADEAARSRAAAHDELRKWQSVMLRQQLDELPADPFYAALALADFWSQFDDEPGLPGPTSDELTSRLTGADRQRLIQRHQAWLTQTDRSLSLGGDGGTAGD